MPQICCLKSEPNQLSNPSDPQITEPACGVLMSSSSVWNEGLIHMALRQQRRTSDLCVSQGAGAVICVWDNWRRRPQPTSRSPNLQSCTSSSCHRHLHPRPPPVPVPQPPTPLPPQSPLHCYLYNLSRRPLAPLSTQWRRCSFRSSVSTVTSYCFSRSVSAEEFLGQQ